MLKFHKLLCSCLIATALSVQSGLAYSSEKEADPPPTKSSKYEQLLLDFKCDSAISALQTPLAAALKLKDFALAAKIMRMIALAFRLDENDRAASQAALIAVTLNPNDERAQFQAAEYLVRDGRWQESESILEKLTKSKNKSTALRASAFLAHQRGNVLGAIEGLEKYSKIEPADQRALLRLSYLYLINEDGKKAAEVQRQLSELSSTDYMKEIFLGRAAESEANADLADEHYRKAGSHLPEDPLWRAQIGLRLMKAQKVKEADAELKQCFAARRLMSSPYTNWALMQAFFGSSENAKSCLAYLKKLRPNASETYFVEGVVLEKICKQENAAAAFKQAIALNPHSSSPYLHLINMPDIQKTLAQRIELRKTWTEGCPNSNMAAIELGNALKEDGKIDEALLSYRRAEELLKGRKAPSDPNARIAICKMHASIACINYQQKDLDAALEEARIFNETRPDSASGLGMRPAKMDLEKLDGAARKGAEHALLADTLSESRLLQDAENEYRLAMKEDPSNQSYHSCLLKVLLDKKDYAAAAAEDAAVSQNIVSHIGDIFSKKK